MSTDSASSNLENALERNFGPQPLDVIMTEYAVSNHDLVAASTEPITHKAVQRARKGRRLTARMQRRMTAALNGLLKGKQLDVAELPLNALFNYKA
jgi:hypothetical protein